MNCSHIQPYLQVKKEGVLSSHDWHLDTDELASKFNKNTKAIIINQPNNPLGKVIQKNLFKPPLKNKQNKGLKDRW